MADVRAQSGVPVAANFGGFLSPTPSTPIVIDLATGGAYFLGTGDIVTSIGSYISGNSQITGTLNVSGRLTLGADLLFPNPSAAVDNVVYMGGVGSLANATGSNLILKRSYDSVATLTISGAGDATIPGAFGCNTKSAQTAFASGGALAAYGAGANGFDTEPHASALYAMVVAIRAALVANGIMS